MLHAVASHYVATLFARGTQKYWFVYMCGWLIPIRVVLRLHLTRPEYCTTVLLAFKQCEIALRLQLTQVSDHNAERVNLDFIKQTRLLRSLLRSSEYHDGPQRA